MTTQAIDSDKTDIERLAGAIDAVDKIVDHAGLLSGQLQVLRQRMYPPEAEKSLRYFMTNEVSKLTSIPESTLRTLSIDGKGPSPARLENNHRAYTLAQVNELRRFFLRRRNQMVIYRFCRTVNPASICRFWRRQTLKAEVQKPRPPCIWPITWRCRAIGF